jgi:hypothetical protein
MTDEIPDDVLNLYGMPSPVIDVTQHQENDVLQLPYRDGFIEIPESIPVEGWTLEIPAGIACQWGRSNSGLFKELQFSEEVQEWCVENIRGHYWFLGEGASSLRNDMRTCAIFFTLEHDYILFKMRWG